MKHGIAIREKATKKLMEFVECGTGQEALLVLSGVRRNLNHEDYRANEEFVNNEELAKMEAEK